MFHITNITNPIRLKHNNHRHPFKRYVCILTIIAATISISFTGCGNFLEKRGHDNESALNSDNSYSTTDNTEFDAYTNELFRKLVSTDTLLLHTVLEHPYDYGIEDYEVTLGRINLEKLDDTSDITQGITELKAFDKSLLSHKQLITYDTLLSYLETSLCYSDLNLYSTSLTPTIGIQIQLPLMFSEYTFLEKKDIDDYISLLCDVDGYCDNLIEYEKLRAQKGFTLEDSLLEEVISSCQSIVSSMNDQNSKDRLFIDDFNSRIEQLDFLSEEEVKTYKELNLNAVHNHVIPGYNILIKGLASIKGTNRYSGGICNYPDGQKYYEGLLEQALGWSKSVEEYSGLLKDYMQSYLLTTKMLLRRNPSLMDSFNGYPFNITGATNILEDLKQRIAEDYPELEDINYSVSEVSDSLCEYASPAMYFLPQLDNRNNNSIYINPNGTSGNDIYPTLAHEGYPGHMYQTQYYLRTNPSPIRSLIAPGGYVEGWASYAEVHSYEYGCAGSELNSLAQCNYAIILCLHALGDIGVNYYGWDEARLSSFLSNWGFNSPDTAHSMYTSLIANPANYCKYVLGFIGFEELKKQARQDLGDDFSLKEFHHYVLENGPVQFNILFSNLKQWEDSLIVVSSRAA